MIKSDIIKIKFTNDNEDIENFLKAQGIEPLRWSVIDVKDDILLVSVSYEI